MKIVTIHAAKTKLSQLLSEVEAGEEIVLARGKTPIAKLTRYVAADARRKPGSLRGRIETGPEFFDALPEEELKAWE
jgi:antitoxin (DNA-binding transcriptional repressor) of toxin-antitoxin stability system